MKGKINLLWAGKTGNANAWYHIAPFCNIPLDTEVNVVRHEPPKREIKGANFFTFSNKNKIIEITSYIFKILLVLIKKKIDVVVTFNPYPWGLIVFMLSNIFKKKIILGLIGGEVEISRNSKFKIKILLLALKKCYRITVTGTRMKRNLVLLGINKDKIFIFPHLIDLNYIVSRKEKRKKFNLITISSFLEVKKTIDAIKALSILHKKGYLFTLCILGDGPLINESINYAENIGLSDYIYFVGYVNDIRSYLYDSEYYIQTSISEGLSISLVEALGAGLIPIVTNAGDEKDIIIDGKTGYVVPINSPGDIAKKILQVENGGNKENILINIMELRNKLDINLSKQIINKILN